VKDYVTLSESIFDFSLIKSFLLTRSTEFRVLFDGLHGVTGPYARALLVDALGLPENSIQNCVPLPDFGGGHPDPNLTYAHSLVDAVEKNDIQFGAASDGDGDRNMIYGKGAFVTPSDSVAIIAHWAHVIPYFKKGGIKGLARSMPTSKAIDLVAKKKGLECFEVPTGESRAKDVPKWDALSEGSRFAKAGSSSATLWMPAGCPSVAKSLSVQVQITSARRMVYGRCSVSHSLTSHSFSPHYRPLPLSPSLA
jgi:phosphomannomutase